jgi:hypothetical protein
MRMAGLPKQCLIVRLPQRIRDRWILFLKQFAEYTPLIVSLMYQGKNQGTGPNREIIGTKKGVSGAGHVVAASP